MKNRRALRIGARWWAGIALLVIAVLLFLSAPGVDDEIGALLSLIVTINAWNALSVASRAWEPERRDA